MKVKNYIKKNNGCYGVSYNEYGKPWKVLFFDTFEEFEEWSSVNSNRKFLSNSDAKKMNLDKQAINYKYSNK